MLLFEYQSALVVRVRRWRRVKRRRKKRRKKRVGLLWGQYLKCFESNFLF